MGSAKLNVFHSENSLSSTLPLLLTVAFWKDAIECMVNGIVGRPDRRLPVSICLTCYCENSVIYIFQNMKILMISKNKRAK